MRSYIINVDYWSFMDGMVLVSDSGNGGVPGPGFYFVSSKNPIGVLHYLSVAIAQENEYNGGQWENSSCVHIWNYCRV